MVRHLGSSLTDITYVFDEPSVGCTRTTSAA
jgi:excinuclease UvrABC ATPase subunit